MIELQPVTMQQQQQQQQHTALHALQSRAAEPQSCRAEPHLRCRTCEELSWALADHIPTAAHIDDVPAPHGVCYEAVS
jgi:hypothetical protein